jgi:hypothetical protein
VPALRDGGAFGFAKKTRYRAALPKSAGYETSFAAINPGDTVSFCDDTIKDCNGRVKNT